ncbi:hypothetical protein OH76DRAFT_629053 [Lentinus brumalis]|uniref:Uncharacterized protein n=1 Tax=Lentinus brumalis TaxID=2498619 RepID=A0A371D8C4_9APHY|nr:hypothetical protein OH76DRAFT_629053 [Polyporus brumalis]
MYVGQLRADSASTTATWHATTTGSPFHHPCTTHARQHIPQEACPSQCFAAFGAMIRIQDCRAMGLVGLTRTTSAIPARTCLAVARSSSPPRIVCWRETDAFLLTKVTLSASSSISTASKPLSSVRLSVPSGHQIGLCGAPTALTHPATM